MKTRVLFIFLLVIAAASAYGQLTVTAEIRPRSELRHGFKTLAEKDQRPAFFTEQRSRLYFDFTQDRITMRFAVQDVRIWGENDQIFKDDRAMFSVSEAWAAYSISPKFSVKLGRQIISYDNQRFLGGLEWAQQGRRHDALLGIYKDTEKAIQLHAGAAYNQDGDVPEPSKLNGTYYARNNYKTMQYLWFNKKAESWTLSALLFNEGRQYGNGGPDSVSNRQTMGFVASKDIGQVTVAGESYVQTGKLATQKVKSYFIDLNVTLALPVTPLTFGYQYLSPQESSSDKITAFDPAYGTNHMHNGYMDYFYVGNGHAAKGLQDFYIKTNFRLSPNKQLHAHLHEFLTAADVLDGDGRTMSGAFGTELDLVLDWKVQENVTINTGYSHMFATDTMEAVKGGDKSATQYWAWLMITFKPTLFTSGKSEN